MKRFSGPRMLWVHGPGTAVLEKYIMRKKYIVNIANNYQQTDKEKNRNKNLYADKPHSWK